MSVIAAVLLSHLRRPYRRDLILLSWSLVAGVAAQIVIGGIVVLTGLNPYANMAHFLVSLVLIASAFILFRRSGTEAPISYFRNFPQSLEKLVAGCGAWGLVAILTGTVVTATGPHAGNEEAVRFGFALQSVARIHSIAVMAFVGLLIFLALRLRTTRTDAEFREAVSALLIVSVFQGAVGYTQYFTGVPVVLVAAHILGAVSMFLALCHLVVAPRDAVGERISGPAF